MSTTHLSIDSFHATAPALRRGAVWMAILVLLSAGCREESVHPGINDHYQDPDVEEWVARFERESREIAVSRDEIVAMLGLRPGMDVADIGAGTGLFTEPLARAVFPGGKVYAVDIVPEFVAHIDERAKAADLSNVETVLCEEDSVKLPWRSVDLVFLCDAYHHFEYPRSTMRSIRHALRPGGELVVIDFERIPGKSREWIFEHVRAGRKTVIAEIESFGFELVPDAPVPDELEENYFIRFRRP